MSALAAGVARSPDTRTPWPWLWLWLALLAATAVLEFLPNVPPAAIDYPKSAVVPFADWIAAGSAWLIEQIRWLTRGIAYAFKIPLDIAFGLFAKGFTFGDGKAGPTIPRLSWVGIVGAVAILGYAYGGIRLALVGGLCFLYIAIFGQWESAMLTLASIVICVPCGVLAGLAVGIWAHSRPRVAKFLIAPLLDFMQTVPAFAYLIPILLLFGNGSPAGLIATIIFAMPPMVRATGLALAQVPAEIQDFGDMVGCSRRQKLWRVMIPSARPLLMVGVNQVIMMSLNMVIIASMIGAGGLGYDVLLALRAGKSGVAFEAGFAIVALAIALDRITQAVALYQPQPYLPGTASWRRHPSLMLGLAVLFLTTAVSTLVPALQAVPKSLTITFGKSVERMVTYININYFDYIEAVRVGLVLHLLNPLKAFLLDVPWLAVVAIVALAGLQLGGWRLALLAATLIGFAALAGIWDITMLTVYLCGISAVIAFLIGMPLGVLSARNRAANTILTVIVDTLQTLPSFVYLIPVVILFRVGDVTAMFAVILFAVAPAIRYVSHGIRQVPPALIEAATASGCTRRQILWRVQLPLALPEILLGANQTILLALSMLVITALVGTRDLGQEVFIALSQAKAGQGIIAGLMVAFIGITVDRLIGAWSRRVRDRFGLA